ncbi:hypothetical protein BDV27DRAFT_142762 [Aspergillus caelatus]|uniref:Rhodopsin domain-containing protein n=1 Tax=Aspergillus caelatus TaxID=61420 RepID=A0A5N7ACD1_9EURO|nr:uncharacterized protein BDV27DRAFT_142762 [Aspergillus caelatus]KAE8367482.1 hypothetical protein BDV27DRAFT_142762 [Aspergillus caelatus]
MSVMDHYSTSVVIESWCLYGIGICLIGCRLASRRIRLGSWKKLQIDDVLMCIIALSFTGVTYTVSEMAQMNNDLVLEDLASSSRTTEQSSYRSKISVTMEQLSVVSLWMIKGCLLLLYNRLTLRTREHRLVQVVAVYVIVTFIVLEILFWAVWCVPPQKYWQCTRFWNHLITTTVLNISSDLLILSIPIPLLIRLQISRIKDGTSQK